jgi:hypothetical protein
MVVALRGISSHDPLAYAAAAGALLIAAIVAAGLPALRAARVTESWRSGASDE